MMAEDTDASVRAMNTVRMVLVDHSRSICYRFVVQTCLQSCGKTV